MIFLDSSYIKALVLKNDRYNHHAKKIKPFLKNEAKVINLTVLVEVLNSIKQKNFEYDVEELYAELLNLDVFDFLLFSDYDKSLDLFDYFGKTINFADCTIINTMFKYQISRIASFDSDFDKIKGFERIY